MVPFSAGKKQNLHGLKSLSNKLNTTVERVVEKKNPFRKMDRMTEKVSLSIFYYTVSLLTANLALENV